MSPDHLPGRDDPYIALQLAKLWVDSGPTEAESLPYQLLPPGLLGRLMARIGDEAGLDGLYWRDGFHVFDERTRSHAIIEQRRAESGWAGKIVVRTQRGQAAELLERLLRLIEGDPDHSQRRVPGARPGERRRPLRETRVRALEDAPGGGDAPKAPTFSFGTPRPPGPLYYVSYAWPDDTAEGRACVEPVDRLCAAAKARQIPILRDIEDMKYYDGIERFMKDIGEGDRIFMVLSDKYWKSPNCVLELCETWLNSRSRVDEMRRRTRIFALPSAGLDRRASAGEKLREVVDYWREQQRRIAGQLANDPDKVLPQEVEDLTRMQRFIPQLPIIFGQFLDQLLPQTVDQFIEAALSDLTAFPAHLAGASAGEAAK